jgi:hypothetical protein
MLIEGKGKDFNQHSDLPSRGNWMPTGSQDIKENIS